MIDREKHYDLVWELCAKQRIKVMENLGLAFEKIVFGTQYGADTEEIRELIGWARNEISIGMYDDPEKRTEKMIEAVVALAEKGVTEARYKLAVHRIQRFCLGLFAPNLEWINYIQYKEV